MSVLYILTGGSGSIGKKFVSYISKFNNEILNLDLNENPNCKYNIKEDLSSEKILSSVNDFLNEYGSIEVIKFIHLACIVGESLNKDWVTNIKNLGIKRSELCYTISVTTPAKLISVFTRFSYVKAIYINSIYGTHLPEFSLYEENPNLQNPMSYGAIKAAQLYSMRWLNKYYKNNLRLNAISPGGIESSKMDNGFKKGYKIKTLGGKFSSSQEVIEASEFLLSVKADSIFNQNLFVDYGFS